MTDPIGTAQERELIEDLRKAAAHVRFSRTGTDGSFSRVLTPAADALQSRIAEVDKLIEDKLFAKRQWAQEGERAERLDNDNRRLIAEVERLRELLDEFCKAAELDGDPAYAHLIIEARAG